MPDKLTILSHPTKVMAKRWLTDGTIQPYDRAKYFEHRQCEVNDIYELSALLSESEVKSNEFMIRGHYIGDDRAKILDSSLYHVGKVRRVKLLFTDEPLHSIMIEVDNFIPQSANPLTDSVICINEYITTCLPSPFSGASYHWQLSNSAGHKNKAHLLKVHLWFWLKIPCTSQELKEWADTNSIKCDTAVFNTVQIHYTSAPVFNEGAENPIATRSGLYRGAIDEVNLEINIASTNKGTPQQESKTALSSIEKPTSPEERSKIIEALKHIPPDCEYNEWLAVLMSLHFALSSDGLALATEWSQKGKKYATGEVQGKFNSFNRESANPRTLGTLFNIADKYKAGAGKLDTIAPLKIMNPADLEGKPVPQQEWIVDSWIPRKTVTSLYGDGGTGKSLLALQLAASMAIGKDFLGLKTAQGKALCFFCEDSEDEVHRRLADIISYLECNMKDLGDNMRYICRVGENNILMEFPKGIKGHHTQLYTAVSAALDEHRPDLLIIDTAADTFGGNEIVRSEVRQFIAWGLMSLCNKYDCTILLCAHPSLAGKEGTGYSGSTAWNNSVRSRLLLKHVEKEPEQRILSKEKSNYARIGDIIDLHYSKGAFHSYNSPTVTIGGITDFEQRKKALKDLIVKHIKIHNEKDIRLSFSSNATNYAPKVLRKNISDFTGTSIPEITKCLNSLILDDILELVPTGRQGGQKIIVKNIIPLVGSNPPRESESEVNIRPAKKSRKQPKKSKEK